MAVEKTGLVAVFETEQFQKGLDTYLKGLAQANTATAKTSDASKKSAQGIAAAGDAASGASTGILALAAGAGALGVSIVTNVIGKVTEATGAILEFGKASLFVAGRVDELNRVALLLGERAGFAQIETQGFLDNLQDVGIRADVAAQLISQLARNQLDLAQATDLATIAGNAAVLTGRDTSDTLESLTQAIVTNQIDVARTAGVNVNFTKAQEDLAKALGTTREQLTEQEKIQANYNAVLAEGQAIAGVYAAAQESPTKALRSLSRQMFNIQAQLGAPFLDAWKSIIDIVRAAVGAFEAMISEGGLLYPLLINVGAAASIMADGLKAGATVVIDFFKSLRFEARQGLVDWIEEAFTFGAELIATFADGMVSAAAEVLTVAMNQIQNLLGFWLAPGSPPRVAPNIGKWGASTFTEYMKGFSDADFGVLKGLQSVLGKILDAPELQAISIDIGAAIGEGGPDEAFFSKLAAAAGDFGEEVSLLARNYFELADAQSQSEMAQQQLNDAMKAMSEAEISVNNLTRQYNELLRAGASDEVLNAQMEQIKAAEQQLVLAGEQKKQAEENISVSEERLKAIAEETGLQEELVNQLLALAQEQERGAGVAGPERAERAGERAGGGLAREMGGLGAGIGGAMGEGITTGISEAIENAKKMLLEKLGHIFAPLKRRWEESIKPTLEDLLERFQEFRDAVGVAWEELKERIQPIIDTFIDWWEVKIPDAIETIKRVIDVTLLPAFRRVWSFVQNTLIPTLRDLADNIFAKIRTAIENIRDFLTGENGLIDAFANLRSFIVDKLVRTLDDFRKIYVEPLVTAFENLRSILERVQRIALVIKQTIEWIMGQDNVNPFEDVRPGTQSDVRGIPGASVMPVIVNVPQVVTVGAGAGNTQSNEFNFNNQVSDNVDLAMLVALIQQVIRQELS